MKFALSNQLTHQRAGISPWVQSEMLDRRGIHPVDVRLVVKKNHTVGQRLGGKPEMIKRTHKPRHVATRFLLPSLQQGKYLAPRASAVGYFAFRFRQPAAERAPLSNLSMQKQGKHDHQECQQPDQEAQVVAGHWGGQVSL